MSDNVVINENLIHGPWEKMLSAVKQTISALTRDSDGVAKFYVGISSKGDAGAAGRFLKKYRFLGYDCIRPVYLAKTDADRKDVEKALIDFFKPSFVNGGDTSNDIEACENEVRGGGGPVGSGDMYVYVAVKFAPGATAPGPCFECG